MRTVAHWDGDSFFASIEQAADRRLRGKPVVVGGEKRGVILSASQEARRLGVRPGWPTGKARRAIPTLVVTPPQFWLYEQFFEDILGLCRETTPLVEPATVGAAWLDLTGTEHLLARDPGATVQHIRHTTQDWLHVSLSAGLATNKLVARLAARTRKPASQTTVLPGEERAFLAPLPLHWLPGLEGETLAALEIAGLRTIGQFARTPLDALTSILGRKALPIQRRAQGISEEPVGKRKRAEEWFTEHLDFPDDQWDEPTLHKTLRHMTENLMAQVRAANVEVRRFTLTLRYTDRAESAKTEDLAEPTALEVTVFPALPGLLKMHGHAGCDYVR